MSSGRDILILDDDVDLAEALAEMLELEGHNVTVVHNGPDAIIAFCETDFDIAFFDVKMPGMNGVECFIELKKIKPNAKVFMMTGYSVEQLLERALEHGALGVLRKPFNAENLLEKVQSEDAGFVVIADDDPGLPASLLPLFRDHGYVVAIAKNGKEAIDIALNNDVDLLILDVKMPLLSGVEVHLELLKHGKKIQTVMMTGHPEMLNGNRDVLDMSSVTGIVRKPFSPEDLLDLIKEESASPLESASCPELVS